MSLALACRSGSLLLLLTAAGVAPSALAVGWEKASEGDGFLMEKRVVSTSEVPEARAQGHSPLPPKTLFSTVWAVDQYLAFVPFHQRVDILKRTDGELLVYFQVKPPMMAMRDYTARITKQVDEASGLYQVFMTLANDAGPKPSPDFVRVQQYHASWTFEPGAQGIGTDITYENHFEIGGSVPIWLVNLTIARSLLDYVAAFTKRAGSP